MSFLVVLVVDDIDACPSVLEAWEQAGAAGITILNSSGIGRLRRAGRRDDIPLMPSLSDFLEFPEVHHRTLFSVVEDQATVDRLIQASEEVTGDLEEAHTGFLFVLPVTQAVGLGKHRQDRTRE